MGQKIHPYGYRVGITQPHAARWFANKYQYPQYVFEDFLLKQSLFKNVPVENLPRKRTDDKSETKLVQIKIERLIRNTIKVKLYVTSPENAQELFDSLDFNNSKKDNLKPTKATSSSNLETKKQLNSFILNIQKKALNKKILQLQILKLQNMQSKLLMFKTLVNPSSFKKENQSLFLGDGEQKGVNAVFLESLGTKSFRVQETVPTLLAQFENSATFYTTQLSKIKHLNLNGFVLLNKFEKNEPISNELKKVLAKNILRARNLELQLEKNSKNLNSTLISKLNTLTTLETKITHIIKLIEVIKILRTNGHMDTITFAEFSKSFFEFSSVRTHTNLASYFNKYCLVLANNLKDAGASPPDQLLKKDFLVGLKTILKKDVNSLYRGKLLYKLSLGLLEQRYNLNTLIELKIKMLMVKLTKTRNKNYILSIQHLNNSLKQNSTFIKQLESWLTFLTKKLNNQTKRSNDSASTENGNSTPSELLRERIYKIDCYVNKIETTMNTIGNQNSSFSLQGELSQSTENMSMEKNLIFVNYNIVKQKLIAELLKMEKSEFLALSTESNLGANFDAQLTKTLQIIQNKLTTLKQIYFDKSGIHPFSESSETQNMDVQNESSSERKAELLPGSTTKTLRLKTALQNLLKTNYENSFVVLQTRRQVYNNIINRFGGKRRYSQILTKEKTWTNPFSKFQNSRGEKGSSPFSQTTQQNLLKDKTYLMDLLDTIQQKLYQRKPVKALETRKQKFLVKKAIKKRLKQYLLLMLMNTNTNLAALKTIYNVTTLSNLCANLTDLQTVPKVSVIELVKVHQPKQYAVCLANFIVENLEKRFSFRSTMKKAAEQAMSTANVKGIKIQIAGRLNGAEIARTEWLRDGVVPLQTLRANIDYSYKTAKTIYGILGVKVWLFKE
uniref:Small ribosomal subunit protein uS3c n=1 Tax=Fritschiella tuberosa TaxID=56004 RepID=A0A6H1XE38_9CHLO|nr:ribosomal protein S3 [Fritschiella tuberosa]